MSFCYFLAGLAGLEQLETAWEGEAPSELLTWDSEAPSELLTWDSKVRTEPHPPIHILDWPNQAAIGLGTENEDLPAIDCIRS